MALREEAEALRRQKETARQHAETIDAYRHATEVFRRDCEELLSTKQREIAERDEYIAQLEAQLEAQLDLPATSAAETRVPPADRKP